VIASFLVVALHVSGQAFGRWDASWWAGNVYDSLTRTCVPLFFMVTGATLLRRDEPLGTFFQRRLLRIVPPLLLWSTFYLWWLHHNGVVTGNWLLSIANGPTMFHLWFFYALVGLYAVVPILRKWYLGSTRSERRLFLLAWFVVASLAPTAHTLLVAIHCEGYVGWDKLGSVYHLSWFAGYAGYLVLGAYLVDEPAQTGKGLALFTSASISMMAANYLLSRQFDRACEFFLVYLTPFVVFAAGGLFMAFMGLRQGTPSRRLTLLSDCSLGIYGLHVFIIDPVFMNNVLQVHAGNPWWTVPAIAIGVYATSFLAVALMRLWKPLRYVI
jgi:surface polysaccharide O-acyltransferase-like enzyme